MSISAKTNATAGRVMSEAKSPIDEGVVGMNKTILIMAGGTGGHVFGSGRAAHLTCAARKLAFAENVPLRCRAVGGGR
jgi:hypothetical protein